MFYHYLVPVVTNRVTMDEKIDLQGLPQSVSSGPAEAVPEHTTMKSCWLIQIVEQPVIDPPSLLNWVREGVAPKPERPRENDDGWTLQASTSF